MSSGRKVLIVVTVFCVFFCLVFGFAGKLSPAPVDGVGQSPVPTDLAEERAQFDVLSKQNSSDADICQTYTLLILHEALSARVERSGYDRDDAKLISFVQQLSEKVDALKLQVGRYAGGNIPCGKKSAWDIQNEVWRADHLSP